MARNMRNIQNHDLRGDTRGFTIIELLVVIGIIVMFLAIAGLSIRGTDTLNLQSAQRTMSGLVNAARSQAEMRQVPVRIAVNDDPEDRDNYLRQIWLVRAGGAVSSPDAGASSVNWIPINDPVRLPAGVFIVPTANGSGVVHQRGGDQLLPPDFFNDYRDNANNQRKSSLGVQRMHINYDAASNPNSTKMMYISFNARGFAGNSYRFIAGLAERQQAGPRFTNSEQITGLLIRPFGTATLVDDPETFGPL